MLVAALLAADGAVCVEGVNTNATRTGIVDVLAAMGAEIAAIAPRDEGGEPVADLALTQVRAARERLSAAT